MVSCLDCFFGGGLGEGEIVTESFMSHILNCESTGIDTTAKDTSWPFIITGNTEPGLPPHGFWQ